MSKNWNDILTSEPVDLAPRPSFQAQLRDGLVGEWNGRPLVSGTTQLPGRPPSRRWLLSAAAVAALLVGGVVIATRPSADPTVQTSATLSATVPSLSTMPAPTSDPSPVVSDPASGTAPATINSLPQVSTSPPLQTTSSAPPITVLTPDPAPLLLEDWPAPSAEPGNLDGVPRMLPSVDIDGADELLRNEFTAGPIGLYDYVQTWIVEDGSGYVEIRTNIDQFDGTPVDFRTSTDIAGWDDAYFVRSGPGFANLRLVAPEGVVWVSSQGLGEDRIVEIANSMTRRELGEPGWEIDETGLTQFNEAGDVANSSRSVGFQRNGSLVAELTISDHALNGAPINWSAEIPAEVFEIDGQLAVATDNGFATAVSWSLADGTGVLFGFRGPIDEAIALARTLTPVDQASWETRTAPDPSTQDGCTSLFC